MPIPSGVATVTVTGAPFGAGAGSTGSVDFTPSTQVLYAGIHASGMKAVYKAPLVAGVISVVLPACDDPAGNPTGWSYHVVEHCDGGSSYDISVLSANGSTQDLSSLAPVSSSLGTPVVVGPPGRLIPFTTVGRPSASTAGIGGAYYDTTLSKPGYSTGSVWKDATGTTI